MLRPSTSLAASLPLLAALACGGTKPPPPPAPAPPKIDLFQASADSVPSGGTVNLSYKVEMATRVSIMATPGGTLLPDTAALEGMLSTPSIRAVTSFVLLATGPGGSAERTVTVMIRSLDAASIDLFSATPPSIDSGGTATLSWRTRNASTVKIDVKGGENVVPAGSMLEGTQEVRPAITTVYVLMATGRGAPVTKTATVTVSGPPRPMISTFKADPPMIARGAVSTLSWTVVNATTVTLHDSAGVEVYRGADPSGSAMVHPSLTETYTLTAMSANGMDTRSLTLPVVFTGATILHFAAEPMEVRTGSSAVLRWRVTDAPGGIEIRSGHVRTTTSADLIGMHTVTPTRTTDYTLIAKNPMMSATATTTVHVIR